MNKVILISVDGTRPDGLLGCGNRFVEEMKKRGSYTLDARSVVPPVTLPAHLSIFHSIPPARHGITTNTFTPFVRPVSGLFEQICLAGGKCAMFYGWEPLRDVARPKSLSAAGFVSARSEENTDVLLQIWLSTASKSAIPISSSSILWKPTKKAVTTTDG